jgi:flagellar P-ring protein precursor FlgI
VKHLLAFLIGTALLANAANAARLKDLTTIRGVRANQLSGYGLVVGLKGTGDSLRNSPFTAQSLRSMLDRLGINVRAANPRTRNVAAVLITAELPPFVGAGSRIDISVASLGDATSLAGGTLIQTPLMAADQKIYAVAQGSVAVSGFATEGKAEKLTHGVPTTGRIANGALVERVPEQGSEQVRKLELELRNPDFTTAVRAADAINAYTRGRYRQRVATAYNSRVIVLRKPETTTATRFLAEIGRLEVQPDVPARVIIDERSGTIVIGENVRISKVAVTHGNLTVRITEKPTVVQPAPFSEGQTAVENRTEIQATQETGNFAVVEGASLDKLVSGLNQMGLKPLGIISILQAIKASGALQAELVVQ